MSNLDTGEAEIHLFREVRALAKTLREPRDEHDLLKTSASLRLILLDRGLANANRELQRKRVFRVNVIGPLSDAWPKDAIQPVFWQAAEGLHPGTFPMVRQVEDLNLDQFLARGVTLIEKQIYSVRDVVKVCANTLGGVHLGAASPGSTQEDLQELAREVQVGGHRAPIRSLIGIGRVTIDALTPLTEAIAAKHGLK